MSLVTDYASAAQFLTEGNKHGRAVSRKKIANNTYVVRGPFTTDRSDYIAPDDIAIVLHETPVVTYHAGIERISLATGGWLTATTCERINRFTPQSIRVISKREAGGSRWWVTNLNGLNAPFRDGVLIYKATGANGSTAWALGGEDITRVTADEDRHNKMVRQLVRDYVRKIKDGTVTRLDSCALCHWTDMPTMTGPYSRIATIPSIGDKMEDQQHLLDHMLDGVLHEALVVHAVRELSGSLDSAEERLDSGHYNYVPAVERFLLTRLLKGAVAIQHGRRPVLTH